MTNLIYSGLFVFVIILCLKNIATNEQILVFKRKVWYSYKEFIIFSVVISWMIVYMSGIFK